MTFEEFNSLLINNKLTLGSVESFTGGLFASSVTAVPGASNFFKGSLVTYFTEEKISLLNISKELVDKFGVVSSEMAFEMASKGREKLNVDICVSFTGNAGPSAMENKQAGEFYIGISTPKETKTYKFLKKGSRDEIRQQALMLAIEKISSLIKK